MPSAPGVGAETVLLAEDILVPDVILPGLDGAELYARSRRERPDLRVLFVPGYTENAIVDPSQVELRPEPFSGPVLCQRVRAALGR